MQPGLGERLETTKRFLRSDRRSRPVVVIADGGDRAEVVLYPSGTTVAVGQTIRHAEAVWEVVAWRPAARAWIARPRGH